MLTEKQLELLSSQRPTVFGKVYLNWTAHSGQSEVLNDRSQFKTISAGRRFGKSESMAVEMLWYAWYHPNSIQYTISLSQEQANYIFSAVYAFAKNNPKINNEIVKEIWSPFPELRFSNGSVIHSRSTSYDGRYLRGRTAHRIVVDEAAFIKDKVLKEVIMPMLADYNGDLVLISTPQGRNYFFEMYERGQTMSPKKREGYASWLFDSYANPHISHKYIDNLREEMLEIQFQTEILAQFVDDQVCVFNWESVNNAVSDYSEAFERTSGRHYYVGVDIARQRDFTCIVVIDGTDPENCKVVYTERFNNTTHEYIFNQVMSVVMQFEPLKVLLDETGVGSGITEQVTNAVPQAEGFIFTMPSKISLVNTLKLGLEKGRLKISDQNSNMINELKYYQYIPTKSTDGNQNLQQIRMSAPSGKFDDCVMALALAFQSCAIPRGVEVYGLGMEEKKYEADVQVREELFHHNELLAGIERDRKSWIVRL